MNLKKFIECLNEQEIAELKSLLSNVDISLDFNSFFIIDVDADKIAKLKKEIIKEKGTAIGKFMSCMLIDGVISFSSRSKFYTALGLKKSQSSGANHFLNKNGYDLFEDIEIYRNKINNILS